MSRVYLSFLACLILALCGCSQSPEHESAIGEAYTGPATLKLHKDLDPHSPEIVTTHHGDHLQILRRRRRFIKVRTPSGGEGWTDVRQLMSAEQMASLDELAELSRRMPSQGAATVYEALNVHTEPNRTAPSFYHVKEGEVLDVISHQLSPRVPFEAKDVLPAPKPRPRALRKPTEEPRIPRPPAPPRPQLPPNWRELSKVNEPEATPTPVPEVEPAKAVPVDDWSLVRLKNGRAGWMLTGMLKMNIPDEVAQYSEGHRITSYFSMADINDGGQIRHQWLWTTLSQVHQPYDFDSFRYFIWNTHHHRYETAHVEGGIKGYFPVDVHPVQAAFGKQSGTFPGFTLILEDEDGKRWRKTYAYEFYRVVLVSKSPVEEQPRIPDTSAAHAPLNLAPEPTPSPVGFFARAKRTVRGWLGKK